MSLPLRLRAHLRSRPSNGYINFVPHIRKLVFEFCESWPTSGPLRGVLRENVELLARENPHVEILVKKRMYKEPIVKGIYCGYIFLCHSPFSLFLSERSYQGHMSEGFRSEGCHGQDSASP